MFFERLFKKKEGQTIERVEASPIETTKTVDAAAEPVLITDEQKHDHDFRVTLTGLEQRLHTSESNEEIIMEAIKTACEFYEAEWAGILIADVETEAWAPMTCYNRLTGRMELVIRKKLKLSRVLVGGSRRFMTGSHWWCRMRQLLKRGSRMNSSIIKDWMYRV